MATMYYEKDGDLGVLKDKIVGIIGYGSQGHAHALNLKDSGQNVMVGLYKGSNSWAKAEEAGLKVAEVAEVAQQADADRQRDRQHKRKDQQGHCVLRPYECGAQSRACCFDPKRAALHG